MSYYLIAESANAGFSPPGGYSLSAGWPIDMDNGEHRSGRQLMITQRLRDRRSELGLTQKQVVTRLARCGVWTTNRALSSLEHGAGIDVARLPELAQALDCTVTYLIGLTEDPHRWEPDHVAREQPAIARRPTHRPAAVPSLIIGGDVPDRRARFGIENDTG